MPVPVSVPVLRRALEIELNSCEQGALVGPKAGYDPTQPLLGLRAVTAALAVVAAASQRRLHAVRALASGQPADTFGKQARSKQVRVHCP